MIKSNIQEMNMESAINFFNKLKQKVDESQKTNENALGGFMNNTKFKRY